ncbi:MAG: peptidoglycan DD-metalloendopeptidase family protein [Porticoccaceae bacterium]
MHRHKVQATRRDEETAPSFSIERLRLPDPRNLVYPVIAGLFFIGITAFIWPHNSDESQSLDDELTTPAALSSLKVQPLELHLQTELAVKSAETEPESDLEPLTITVKNGDSMSLIFERAGLGPSIVHQLAYESEHGSDFSKVLPGKQFHFYFDKDNQLTKVVYEVSRLEQFEAQKDESGFATRHIQLEPELFTSIKSGEINSSFYLDGLAAGLNDNLIMELANIFGWDIDFALEIRAKDSFSVVFEEKYLDGEFLGTGRILAAEFVNKGNTIRAVRYEDSTGKASYYTPEGLSMRKAFLRTPMDVFRISSHFNLSRKHPVLNTIRAHKGTDYAAPRGTPVKAAGDGKVEFAGRNGGYGNMVQLKHGQSYETRYAHLNAFAKGIKSGQWVKQGQIIGYVGSTGLATGPHLHYEFYVNGAVRNPVTVQLPDGDPIASSELANFKAVTQPMLAMLQVSSDNYVQVATSDAPNGT